MKPEEALWIIEHFVDNNFPQRPHLGSCGPEAGCDATCMDVAALSEAMRVLRQRLGIQ